MHMHSNCIHISLYMHDILVVTLLLLLQLSSTEGQSAAMDLMESFGFEGGFEPSSPADPDNNLLPNASTKFQPSAYSSNTCSVHIQQHNVWFNKRKLYPITIHSLIISLSIKLCKQTMAEQPHTCQCVQWGSDHFSFNSMWPIEKRVYSYLHVHVHVHIHVMQCSDGLCIRPPVVFSPSLIRTGANVPKG